MWPSHEWTTILLVLRLLVSQSVFCITTPNQIVTPERGRSWKVQIWQLSKRTNYFWAKSQIQRQPRVFAVAIPSVYRLSVVCNVRAPYSADWNFRHCFYAILYSSHPLTSVQNFTEIIPEKPLRRRLNARGVAKYSDFGHVEGYISETVQVQPRVQLMTNRKSCP